MSNFLLLLGGINFLFYLSRELLQFFSRDVFIAMAIAIYYLYVKKKPDRIIMLLEYSISK